jgi:preprotein translocase subunit SecG
MHTVIIVIHLMIVLAMVGLILLQKSEGGGLGMGGGAGFMSTRGSTNLLSRSTAILAAIFFTTSLILSMMAGIDRRPSSILDSGPGPAAPTAPGAPVSPGGGGVLDQLRGGEPQPPAGPQVPRSQ